MTVRRAFWYWQFAAALVLPSWVLLGYAIWGGGASGLLGVAIGAPLLVIAALGLAALFNARASVRRARALGWADVGVLAVFSLAVLGLGFFGPFTTWFGVVAIAAALGGFWLGTVELVTELRQRMRATLDRFGLQRPPAPGPRTPIDAGEYVVRPKP